MAKALRILRRPDLLWRAAIVAGAAAVARLVFIVITTG